MYGVSFADAVCTSASYRFTRACAIILVVVGGSPFQSIFTTCASTLAIVSFINITLKKQTACGTYVLDLLVSRLVLLPVHLWAVVYDQYISLVLFPLNILRQD